MNPATFDAARLIDADFLNFLAAAGWGVNAGVVLFFVFARSGDGSRGSDRGLWLMVAATFLSTSAVCIAHLVGHYGALFRSAEALDVLGHAGAAAATLFGLAALTQVIPHGTSRKWRWGAMGFAAAVVGGVSLVPAIATGWWLGLCAGGAGLLILVSVLRTARRCPHIAGLRVVFLPLGLMLLALGVVFGARHLGAPPWNVPPGAPTPGGSDPGWQGALLAGTAIIAFALLWRKYLEACTLPRIRGRRGVLGLRPLYLLPVLEGVVLVAGSGWFIASSRQAEEYAARRLRAEVAMALASLDDAGGVVSVDERDPAAARALLERLVRRSESFVAAVAWVGATGRAPEVIASVTRERSAAPFDAAGLLPNGDERARMSEQGGLRWMRGSAAFERAIVVAPLTLPSGQRWWISLAAESPDLAGLVAAHRLQALAILALAAVLVAIAVVYAIRTLNESELRLLKESAEAENTGRNAFLGMISHEIRTPLQSVLGYAELAEGTGLPDGAARHVRAIRTQGAILLRIVQDILDFSALRGGGLTLNPEVVSLRELLDDVQRGMAGRAQSKGIVFSTEVDGTVPEWVTVDRVRLTQVLLNLAVNAVKFTDRGGVRVSVGCAGIIDGKAAIEILVSDTGPGINAAQMRRLFEPFRKMRDDDTPGGGGVGLGLAISRQIVDLLRGTITVESVDREGAVFRLRLDLGVAAAPAAFPAVAPGAGRAPIDLAETPATAGLPSLAGLRVLLIDDNPYVRDLLRDFLLKLGAAVVARADGTSGLEACARERFDVVLLDLRLPDFQGAELAARLRAAGRAPDDPWIVGISAGVSDEEIQTTLERGVNDFMLKPVSMGGLAETIRMSPAAARITPEAPRVPALSEGLAADQRAAFFAELEPMFDRLEQSCMEEHGARLGAEAHYLANGCLVTGFDEGLGVCREIEQLAEAGAFAAARQRIVALRRRFAVGDASARGA